MKKIHIKESGITIITLVITIIILLILAGISIATLVGNDGLINKAKKAAKDYENAQEDELAKLNNIIEYSEESGMLDNETGDISDDKYKDLLQRMSNLESKMQSTLTLDTIYPVGSVYISTDLSTAEAVNEKFGGTWESYGQGKTLIGEGTGNDGTTNKTFTANSTGGEYNHTLSIAEMPKHRHTVRAAIPWNFTTENVVDGPFSNLGAISAHSWKEILAGTYEGNGSSDGAGSGTLDAGASQPHNIVQPYIVVYMWKRVM